MAKNDAANTPAVTGNVMFYEKPVPLNKEQHATFGVKQVSKPFEFMAHVAIYQRGVSILAEL